MSLIEETRHGLKVYKFNHEEEWRILNSEKALGIIEQLKATNKDLLIALEQVKYELQANPNMDSASLFSKCVEAFHVAEKAITNAKQVMGDSDD